MPIKRDAFKDGDHPISKKNRERESHPLVSLHRQIVI